MSKNIIIGLLDEIIINLNKLNHPSVDYLNQGLSNSDIYDFFINISLQATEDLTSLFSWRNGVSNDRRIVLGHLALFPGFYFMTLKECCNQYMELKKNNFWKDCWFPVFTNGGGDFYAMDINTSEILGYYVYEDEIMVEYNSLKSMLETYNRCYEVGIIYKNSEGYLDMDYKEHAMIAHVFNPNLSFWIDFIES